jgi:hypothetical protein
MFKKLQKIARALSNKAQHEGLVDLSLIGCPGSFLQSSKNIKEEHWYKEEQESGSDFDADDYAFWVTTDNGENAVGFDDPEHFVAFLVEHRRNLPALFFPVFSVNYAASPQENSNEYTGTDYARYFAVEINRKAREQGFFDEYCWFERELSEYSESIGFDRLYISLSEIVEID